MKAHQNVHKNINKRGHELVHLNAYMYVHRNDLTKYLKIGHIYGHKNSDPKVHSLPQVFVVISDPGFERVNV